MGFLLLLEPGTLSYLIGTIGPTSADGSQPTGSNAFLEEADISTVVFYPDLVGDYFLSLVVSDGTDDSAPDYTLVTVVLNQPPVAVAAAEPTSGPAPLSVQFDGTGSYDPEDQALSYDWNFGDSQVGTGPTPTHTYDYPGSYEARLKVTDERGEFDFDTVDITVTEPIPVPALGPGALGALASLLLATTGFALHRRRH